MTSPRSTRYAEVAAALRAELLGGDYEIGSMFLTELEICSRFAVSRFTAREALRLLDEAGLVERRQGSGTKVLARQPEHRYLLTTATESEVLRYTRDTVLVVKSTWRAATSRHREEHQLDDDRDWVVLEGVRRTAPRGRAIGATTVFVDASLGEHLGGVEPSGSQAIFVQVASAARLRLTRIDQEIYATAMDARTAKRLNVAEGVPALGVARRFTAEGIGCFEVSVTVHPADSYRFRLSLTDVSGSLSEKS